MIDVKGQMSEQNAKYTLTRVDSRAVKGNKVDLSPKLPDA
jgi:hypothetical protein